MTLLKKISFEEKSDLASVYAEARGKTQIVESLTVMERTHPTKFTALYHHDKVKQVIESKNPAGPLLLLASGAHTSFVWKLKHKDDIYHPLLSDINEFTLQNPLGLLCVKSLILLQIGLPLFDCSLVFKESELNNDEPAIIYGGKATCGGEGNYVFLTFEKNPQTQKRVLSEICVVSKHLTRFEELKKSQPTEGAGSSAESTADSESSSD